MEDVRTIIEYVPNTMEFSRNVFTEFSELSDKKIKNERIAISEPTISCVRDRDDTTVPQRHR